MTKMRRRIIRRLASNIPPEYTDLANELQRLIDGTFSHGAAIDEDGGVFIGVEPKVATELADLIRHKWPHK